MRRQRRKNKAEEMEASAAIDDKDGYEVGTTAGQQSVESLSPAPTATQHPHSEVSLNANIATAPQNLRAEEDHVVSSAHGSRASVPAAHSAAITSFSKQISSSAAAVQQLERQPIKKVTEIPPMPPAAPVPPGRAGELFAMLMGSNAASPSGPTPVVNNSVVNSTNTVPRPAVATTPAQTADMSAVVRLSSALGLGPSTSAGTNGLHMTSSYAADPSANTFLGNSALLSNDASRAASNGQGVAATSGGGAQYYKSKSGFVVRL